MQQKDSYGTIIDGLPYAVTAAARNGYQYRCRVTDDDQQRSVSAFRDGGIKIMSITTGPRTEYTGGPNMLPYGHAFRLLHNRKPETILFA